MGKVTASPIVDQARLLLNMFRNTSDAEVIHHADDLLSYFLTLRNHHGVANSRSPRFSGKTFHILEEVIYELESDPEATLLNDGFKEFIVLVLEDIALNRIDVIAKPAGN
ncbi:MAG: hypothetical protein HYR76_10130 [Ignavibacteria bacterium]|nr:hypothetical protein [Ignavibacteria bacterium]MBI3765558.1 hypothetical protein [Ignavibacteriales bacterium]